MKENIHLVYGDVHASPTSDNSRADLLSKLIRDVQPSVVVNVGDVADMSSLSSYDKGMSYFAGRNYQADIEASVEFEDRVWTPIKRLKKKLPLRIACIGNHDYRIERAIQKQPELAGAISLKDLQLETYYDDVIHYDGWGTPGSVTVDGILYAHYVPAGLTGKALSSIHQGYQLLQKLHRSVVVGHQHVLSYEKQSVGERFINGLCLPCFTEERFGWAGSVADLWSRGVCILRNVDDGDYDLEVVSLERLKKEYGGA